MTTTDQSAQRFDQKFAQQFAEKFARVAEQLTAENLDELAALFAPSARFKDPFNDVVGREAIVRVFAHGFKNCPNLRFIVLETAFVPDTAIVYFYWEFHCGGTGQLKLQGVSRVVFDTAGLVTEHIDYWDPAEQLYDTVPILGALLRWVRRRLSAPTT